MTRAVREPDDNGGEIIERFFFWWGFEMNEMRWRGHTNDTIDKNKPMGSAHSRTSACVSAQHAPTDRDGPTTWTWFTSCLLPNGAHRLQAIGGPPHDPAGCRLAALVVVERFTPLPARAVHVSCQSRRFFSRKTKNLVSRPETLFFIDATGLARPLRHGGGGAIRSRRWSESPQRVGQIAPRLPPYSPGRNSGTALRDSQPRRRRRPLVARPLTGASSCRSMMTGTPFRRRPKNCPRSTLPGLAAAS